MKLLFDQNISHRLCTLLRDLYPNSAHVRDFNLHTADDATVWEHAKNDGFAIVSKDDDFHQRSFLHGHPPKVVWVRLGNCSTDQIAVLLRERHAEIQNFTEDPDASFLSLR